MDGPERPGGPGGGGRAVVISLIGGGEPETSEPQAPENQLLVSDLYEGERYVPKFDYPLNEYDTEGFTEQNGFIQYPGAVLGVDVSEHQGDIDWQAVRGAGVEFAILRVGYRGMTEGGLNVDATFEQNYQGLWMPGCRWGSTSSPRPSARRRPGRRPTLCFRL